MSPNPESFRFALLGTGTFDWGHLAYSTGFMVVTLFVEIVIFNRTERRFIDTV